MISFLSFLFDLFIDRAERQRQQDKAREQGAIDASDRALREEFEAAERRKSAN